MAIVPRNYRIYTILPFNMEIYIEKEGHILMKFIILLSKYQPKLTTHH